MSLEKNMPKYKNAAAPVCERVEDLLSRMTLEQKIAQLQCAMCAAGDPADVLKYFPHGVGEIGGAGMGQSVQEIIAFNKKIYECLSTKGLGIPPIIHAEALTGLNSPDCTIFPSAIGLGATFNSETVYQMADITRQQMLAVGYRQALSPVMDVCRDPRWGRIGETYGEDPTLNAEMSTAFTRGLQGENLTEGVVATGKHFLGYGTSSGGLNMTSNPIGSRELREVYAKPFQAAISEGGLKSIMNSYGVIDGDMVIGSERILTGLLRDEMEFDGVVVSDYMSLDHLVDRRLAGNMNEAGIKALKAGLDVECPIPMGYTPDNLAAAVRNGKISEALIDRSVRRVLEMKFELGLFDKPEPHEEILERAYNDPAHMECSLKAARESIVLLKNDGILPLSKELRKIAVIGPHGDSIRMMFGGYTRPASLEMILGGTLGDMAGMSEDFMEIPDFMRITPPDPFPGSEVRAEHSNATYVINMAYASTPTIRGAIAEKCPGCEVVYARGCDIAGTDRTGFEEAIALARSADVVILTLGGKYGWGLSATIGEGIDSSNIGLLGVQEELAKAIFETGTPAVLVHMDARPLSSEYIAKNYPAIIENWFPGSTGGRALADVLFADYNPAGRLPVTIARHAGQLPLYSGQYCGDGSHSKETKKILNRYVDDSKEPLFCFGHGLSYTDFSYRDLQVTPSCSASGSVEIRCKVKNIGAMDGEEVVQLYISDEIATTLRPQKEFAGSKRVFLKAGEEKQVVFTVRADQFALVNLDMKWVVEEGKMGVYVGASADNLPLTGSFYIDESAVINGAKRGFFAKATFR